MGRVVALDDRVERWREQAALVGAVVRLEAIGSSAGMGGRPHVTGGGEGGYRLVGLGAAGRHVGRVRAETVARDATRRGQQVADTSQARGIGGSWLGGGSIRVVLLVQRRQLRRRQFEVGEVRSIRSAR